MHGRNWKDRLSESMKQNKASIIVAVVVILIMSIVVVTQTVNKADIAQMEQAINVLNSKVSKAAADITDAKDDIKMYSQQYNGVANTVAMHNGILDGLRSRIDTAEGNITAIRDNLPTVDSPPEVYLTGTVGNYTLHARASEAGNYTANVKLVFSPPISAGNVTTYDEAVGAFYGSVNSTAANAKPYVPVASYNGTAWGISQVWWNIGTFAMAADTDKVVSVVFGGLNATYDPTFAYVEVYPVLK